MATSTTSKCIHNLRPREPSVKTVSERKYKPRKVVATSKNLKKVNVSIRGKSLHISKRNISVRNSQTSMIRLRPRRNRKNYCEDSRLLRQYILPKQRESMVMLEKLNLDGSKKVPVYKTLQSSEQSLEDKNDVYDFQFDINDTKEKAIKKKKPGKRKVNKGKSKIIKKTTRKKDIAQPKTISHEGIESSKPDANLSVNIAQSNPEFVIKSKTQEDIMKKFETPEIDTDFQMLKESANKDIRKEFESLRIDTDVHTVDKLTENTVEIMETSSSDIQVVEKTTSDGSVVEIKEENTNKPRIVSIENANDIVVTKSPPNTEDSWPFRPKNIFDNKTSLMEHNSTLKCSLLKTLSPIIKTTNTLDLGSPWRPSTLMFSQTKHFIQSTPYKNLQTHKESKEINKKNMKMNKENMEINKENMEINKENMEMDKENMDINKENKGRRDKERKKKNTGLHKKHIIQKKLPNAENQTSEKVCTTAVASKSIIPAPARVSLGEIKNLLQKPNINGDNKQSVDQTYTEGDKSLVERKNKLIDVLNFSDTFDVLSETEKLSNIENDVPLFMDLEPTHFSKPPQHSYRRKRAVKFDLSEDSIEEEEKENVKSRTKKKKLTKSEKEQEKRINEWVKTVNTTFQEIEEYDLVIE